MYFVKFDDIAVFVKESAKLVSHPLSYEIFELDEDVNFKKLSRKHPFANCKRFDYFDTNKKVSIPMHVMNYILNLPEVKAIMIAKDRDNKIDEILN